MVSRRFWSTVLLALGAVLGAAPALAQTDPNALATADFMAMKIQRPDGEDWVDMTKLDQDFYFNQARCQCGDDAKVRVVVQVASGSRAKLAAKATTGTYARLYVGQGCAALNSSNQPVCTGTAGTQLGNDTPLSTLSSAGSWVVETTVKKIFGNTDCAHTGTTTIYLWVDSTGLQRPDTGVQGDQAPYLPVALKGAPPASPTGVTVRGGNEAIEVSWAPIDVTNNETVGFVVFCMRGPGLIVFKDGFYDDQYVTAPMLCGRGTVTGGSTTAVSTVDALDSNQVDVPAHFQTLDQAYMCSGRLSASDTSHRIGGLQNDIVYTVGVAAVDKSGNISPVTTAFAQKPIPTVDFYQAYRNAGGETQGGYCSLAGWTGRPGVLGCLALASLLGVSFTRRRRRRGSSGLRGLTVLLVLLGAGTAQAQPPAVTHEEPVREDVSKTFEEPQQQYRTPKNFAFELRFGAFRPDIDSEFSNPDVHPYKDVYGGKRHLMSQFELDWQLFQAFGSLSLAGVVGYYSQSAKARIAGTDKPSGDNTDLRLIPTAALLVYRFDVIALRYGIPLVPYAKMGLNYTFWRITNGNGDVPHFQGGRGSGGTLGWQAAAGISLMLDFIDPTAAHGLDIETGVNHTYAFFEWDKVEANGLGQSKKLHVGDSSWVVGLMFEF